MDQRRLAGIERMMLRPQRLKPARVVFGCGTAEAVSFQG